MTCKEYINEKDFDYRTFFILAQGNLSYREFVKRCGLGSTYIVAKSRSEDCPMPSLLTVKRLAAFTGVDAQTLWLKVCNQIFNEKEDFILRRR